MHYCCTHLTFSSLKSPEKVANAATQHMQGMAAQGWRLVSTTPHTGSANAAMYLFWQWG